MYRLLCFLLVSLVGCAPALQGVVSDSKILERLKFNNDRIQSFRGMGRIHFSLREGSGTLEAIVVAKQNNRLRIETGNFFGVPLSALALNENKLSFYVIPEEKYYTGRPSNSLLKKLLPLRLSKKELLGLLYFTKASYQYFKDSKKFKVEFMKVKKKEKSLFYYPSELRITHIKTDQFMHIKWDEYNLNPTQMSDRLFQIDKPEQARRIKLDAGEPPKPLLKGEHYQKAF